MNTPTNPESGNSESGKARYGILLWLLGIPLPIILIIFLITGC